MIAPRLFLCSGAKLADGDPLGNGKTLVQLDSIGPRANVNIRLENVARILNKHIPPRIVDVLEIASYIFTGDCATSRGRQWTDNEATESWDRDLSFVVPVRDVTFWQRSDVRDLLREILEFLSNDKYAFAFVPLKQDRTLQSYLQFGSLEDWPFYGVDRVVMFSGGLDSLAGAVQMARNGYKSVLVSHRPVTTLDSRQRRLFSELDRMFPGQMIHVPVWINKEKNFGRESTQRTRSFLYSTLGTVVAESIKSEGVRFFENGVVSLNLPVADEVLRARASRTTHPRALRLFENFFALVTGRRLRIDNPFLFKTKAEIVESIVQGGAGDLIRHTCSCAHLMFKSKSQWHCGTCSQCTDRRFAVTSAGCTKYDPETDYASDVFTGPRKEGYERNMAIDYVRHAIELDRMSEEEIASKFNLELSRAVRFEERPSNTAQHLIGMHKRHGENVARVLQDELGRHSGKLFSSGLDPTSLLSMAIGGRHLEPSWKSFCDRIVGVLSRGVPIACQSNKPTNEPRFQEICDGLLKSNDIELVREYPFMRWSSSLT
ncbi:MAG TPA: 7-cyano-7-deazaguanine synthase, partial [Terriglobia bacterium]|nr:7-cyano-7-deazaguanine synthase [Terriglobia bacterium]